MTGPDAGDVVAGLVGLVFGAVTGWFTPHVIARLPEPEPDPEPDPAEKESRFARTPARAKVLYVDLATGRGLAWRCALVTALVAAAFGTRLGWGWDLLVALPMAPVGVALTYIDWRTTYLPTRIIAPTYGVVIAAVLVASLADGDRDELVRAAIGWAIYGGLFFGFWYLFPRGWGYGDVRLSGVLGLVLGFLGWPALYVGLLGGVLLGGVGGVVLTIIARDYRRRFPFGPFMLVAAFVAVLWGHAITTAMGYEALLG